MNLKLKFPLPKTFCPYPTLPAPRPRRRKLKFCWNPVTRKRLKISFFEWNSKPESNRNDWTVVEVVRKMNPNRPTLNRNVCGRTAGWNRSEILRNRVKICILKKPFTWTVGMVAGPENFWIYRIRIWVETRSVLHCWNRRYPIELWRRGVVWLISNEKVSHTQRVSDKSCFG